MKNLFTGLSKKEFPATQEGIDRAIDEFNNTLNIIALQVFPKRRRKKKSLPKIKKKWYDKSCYALKSELRGLAKQCSSAPQNSIIRQNFNITKRNYKKLLKQKESCYIHSIRDKLIDTLNKDPQLFWKSIKYLKKDQYDEDTNNPVKLDTWFDYFSALYSKKSMLDDQFEIHNIDSPVIPELHTFLNKIITVKEVKLAISILKNGKAPGEDRVLNKVLKSGELTLPDSLCKIFNIVFASERYPCSWCKILVPVFKSGIPDNPDNYRGISIGSCIGKVYSMVFFNHLIDAIDNFNLLSKNQIGFLKGYRTADHSFAINSIADHFVKTMKQDIYVAFVDLRKALDTVNRKASINKLYKKESLGSS